MTEISEKALKTIEARVKSYPAHWSHGVCALAIISREKGTETGPTTGYICHAPLNNIQDKGQIVVNAHKDKWQNLDGGSDYMRWVARESPFSHGVINKDNDKEILNHASVIDTELVGNGGALWLGKAFRYFVEDTWKPGTWAKLRNEGLDGFQAFIGASILDANGDPMTYSHVTLFGYTNPLTLRKVYDEMRTIGKIKGSNASCCTGYGRGVPDVKHKWGSLKGKARRIPDGWGGYTEKMETGGVKEYAAQLKEIFEGDPKNVK
jgi:hypothetical protein